MMLSPATEIYVSNNLIHNLIHNLASDSNCSIVNL